MKCIARIPPKSGPKRERGETSFEVSPSWGERGFYEGWGHHAPEYDLGRPWPLAILGDAAIGARLLPIHRVGNLLIPYTKPTWVRSRFAEFCHLECRLWAVPSICRGNQASLYIGRVQRSGWAVRGCLACRVFGAHTIGAV